MTERRLPSGMVPRLLSRQEAACYLSISTTYFDTHVAGAVPAVIIGNVQRWDVRALDDWIDRKQGGAPAAATPAKWLERLGA